MTHGRSFVQYIRQMISPDQLTVLDCQALRALGGRLRRRRKAQGLGTVELANQAGISRMTLRAVESGDPSSSMASYLRVMAVLGWSGELATVAVEKHPSTDSNSDARRSRSAKPAHQPAVLIHEFRHQIQDLQSLALHRQAVHSVQQEPALLEAATRTLNSWIGANPDSRSMPLWREWALILEKRTWRKILAQTQRGQQLRQASPLVTVLPQEIRLHVLAQVDELRQGRPTGNRPSSATAKGP